MKWKRLLFRTEKENYQVNLRESRRKKTEESHGVKNLKIYRDLFVSNLPELKHRKAMEQSVATFGKKASGGSHSHSGHSRSHGGATNTSAAALEHSKLRLETFKAAQLPGAECWKAETSHAVLSGWTRRENQDFWNLPCWKKKSVKAQREEQKFFLIKAEVCEICVHSENRWSNTQVDINKTVFLNAMKLA